MEKMFSFSEKSTSLLGNAQDQTRENLCWLLYHVYVTAFFLRRLCSSARSSIWPNLVFVNLPRRAPQSRRCVLRTRYTYKDTPFKLPMLYVCFKNSEVNLRDFLLPFTCCGIYIYRLRDYWSLLFFVSHLPRIYIYIYPVIIWKTSDALRRWYSSDSRNWCAPRYALVWYNVLRKEN